MTNSAHKAWLKVAAVVVGSFGPIFTLAAAGFVEPARLALDILDWPLDGGTQFSDPETRFLSALAGGFLIGWGITLWSLSGRVYDRAPEHVRLSVVTGLCAWFVFDSIGSALSGVASNVLFNAVVLIIAVGPMWRPARGTESAKTGGSLPT